MVIDLFIIWDCCKSWFRLGSSLFFSHFSTTFRQILNFFVFLFFQIRKARTLRGIETESEFP